MLSATEQSSSVLIQESNRATRCRERLGLPRRMGDISEAVKPRARGMVFPAEGTVDAKALVVGEQAGERARPAACPGG